jgi:hypothetical protein
MTATKTVSGKHAVTHLLQPFDYAPQQGQPSLQSLTPCRFIPLASNMMPRTLQALHFPRPSLSPLHQFWVRLEMIDLDQA